MKFVRVQIVHKPDQGFLCVFRFPPIMALGPEYCPSTGPGPPPL